MSQPMIVFTGDKVKDAKSLETNGIFQRYLSNIDGMNMQAECAITGSTAMTPLALIPEPTALTLVHTQEQAELFNTRLLKVRSVNMATTIQNNKLSKAKADVRMELCTAIEKCETIMCTVDPTINIHTLSSLELYQIVLAYLVLDVHDINTLTKQVQFPFKSNPTSTETLEEQIHIHERSVNNVYQFVATKASNFRDNEKIDHMKERYKATFAPAIALANAHHASPTTTQIMTFITNSAKSMDRDDTWRTKVIAKPKDAPKEDFKEYCWAHGPNSSHSPYKFARDPTKYHRHECKASSKVPGFQVDATFAVKMGGKTKRWAPGDKLGP